MKTYAQITVPKEQKTIFVPKEGCCSRVIFWDRPLPWPGNDKEQPFKVWYDRNFKEYHIEIKRLEKAPKEQILWLLAVVNHCKIEEILILPPEV